MVGLICGEVWGFGERESGHLVCRKILRRKDERKKALKTLSLFEEFFIFITDLKINKNDGSPTHYYHSVNSV